MNSYFSSLSPVIAFVVALLLGLSFASWVVIFSKLLLIRRVRKGMDSFLGFFWETGNLPGVEAGLEGHRDCPLAGVFVEGYAAAQAALEAEAKPREGLSLRTDLSGIDIVARRLRKAAGREAEDLEKNLGLLATTGSTAPFIGLFGTVWGIMTAFRMIGETGSTSLDVVAPGISEALVTTALGLAVAIPAVVAFNYLQGRIRSLRDGIEGFASDLQCAIQRILEAGRG